MPKLLRSAAAILSASALAVSLVACSSDSETTESTETEAASGSADSDQTLTFAAIPAESSESLESDYSAIVEAIEQETGVEVEFQNLADYASLVEGQRAGQIDIAGYGPFTYVIAKDSGVPIEVVAAPTDDENEPPTYTSRAYVRADTDDINSLDDIEGRNVCFVDVASTSGYLVPTKGVMDAGFDMDEDINQILAGGHDASLLSLDAGDCDVAFAQDTMLNTLTDSGQLEDGALREIWKSEEIFEYPIAIRSDIEPEVKEGVIRALQEKANKPALVEMDICESEDECDLPEETGWGYVPVTDEDFDGIREICEVTQAESCYAIS